MHTHMPTYTHSLTISWILSIVDSNVNHNPDSNPYPLTLTLIQPPPHHGSNRAIGSISFLTLMLYRGLVWGMVCVYVYIIWVSECVYVGIWVCIYVRICACVCVCVCVCRGVQPVVAVPCAVSLSPVVRPCGAGTGPRASASDPP